MKYLNQEESKSPKRKAKRLLKIAVIFTLAVLSLELWTVNRLSTYGDRIQSLKEAQSRLELENQVLENTIAQESSLSVLEERAYQLGFNNIKSYQYPTSQSLASLR